MFKSIYKITFFLALLLSVTSCDEYLDRTPDAEVTELDIFGTYEDFQGFIDPMYSYIIDYNSHALTTGMCIGGEVIGFQGWSSGRRAMLGNYWAWMNNALQTNFDSSIDEQTGETDSGIWPSSWRGIRIANLALEKIDLLADATTEEKNLIRGQALFFRAWFHWEVSRSFGSMPYIDQYLAPTDDLKLPRLTWQEMAERIVQDFDEAAALLPEDWDDTTVGSQFKGANAGRATKGAALGFKAKTLLFAGSPLMNKFSGGPADFDLAYMKRAAEAAAEVIKLADKGVYSLIPFENYRDNFAKNNGEMPWTSETVFQKVKSQSGSGEQTGRHGRLFTTARWGGNGISETVNQLYVDRFEMADGTRYKIEYDNDDTKRWENRDPRFRQNVLVDRDKWGENNNTVVGMYVGGIDKKQAGALTCYMVKKFWPKGVNKWDKQWNSFRYVTPHLRLAEIYLIYAEGLTESDGPTATAGGLSINAVDALNIVRRRAGMPDVTAAATGYDSFRDLVWNERWVELCFEGHWWFDIRRWYVAHLEEYKPVIDLEFDKDWTSFTRVQVESRVFDDPKHYWMPLPREQTQLFPGFGQNPGW